MARRRMIRFDLERPIFLCARRGDAVAPRGAQHWLRDSCDREGWLIESCCPLGIGRYTACGFWRLSSSGGWSCGGSSNGGADDEFEIAVVVVASFLLEPENTVTAAPLAPPSDIVHHLRQTGFLGRGIYTEQQLDVFWYCFSAVAELLGIIAY